MPCVKSLLFFVTFDKMDSLFWPLFSLVVVLFSAIGMCVGDKVDLAEQLDGKRKALKAPNRPRPRQLRLLSF